MIDESRDRGVGASDLHANLFLEQNNDKKNRSHSLFE